MKNRSGKGNMRTQMTVLIVLVALLGIYIVFGQSLQSNFGAGSEDDGLSSGACNLAPTLDVNVVNALKQGTSVSAGVQARVNDAFIGTITADGSSSATPFAKGDEVEILVNSTNFLDKTLDPIIVNCGINTANTQMHATSTNSFRIFTTNGDPLTDAAGGGATNQSSSASPINLEVFIDSKSDESTGDLVVVVESTNTTEVENIVFSGNGASSTSTPDFYSPNAAGSIVKAFNVPALFDGESKQYTLTFDPESGKTIGASDNSIYVTAYSKQAFVDVDGTFKVGVEDSDGTVKYEDEWDFDFMIT